MHRFLSRLTIFLSIQMVIAAFLLVNALNKPEYGFMAAFEDKIALLEQHNEPSLIVVGGSNTIFGINSEVLEEQIGMPTINTGLHAGLGLKILLDVAEAYARPGDVILMIPEYPLLSSRFYPQDWLSQELIRQSPSGWKFIAQNPGFDTKNFVDNRGLAELAFRLQCGFKHYNEERLQRHRQRALQPGAYSRLNFNRHGDFVGHHGLPQAEELRNIENQYYFIASMYAKSTAAINECARKCEAKGAKMYFAYCPVPESMYSRTENALHNAHRYLQEHLEIPILHAPEDVIFPESSFYDTACHLNESGKHERTLRVAQHLKNYFTVVSHKPKSKKDLRR